MKINIYGTYIFFLRAVINWSRNRVTAVLALHLYFLSCAGFAQNGDSVMYAQPSVSPRASGIVNHRMGLIVPAVFISAGTAIMLDSDADEFFLSNLEVREERNENFIHFSNHLDDYLQHVSSFSAFALSISGCLGWHGLPDQAALFVKSEIVMVAVVYTLKYSVGEARPDSGQKNSFPSGHTAQAFAAATFLSKEYGYKSIWISVGAYTAAATVGAFRMLNNRHWISDVLVGAGIGILSTEFVFRTHKMKLRKSAGKTLLAVNPFTAYGSEGLSLRYKFWGRGNLLKFQL